MGNDITTRMGATMKAWDVPGEDEPRVNPYQMAATEKQWRQALGETPEEGEWPKRDAVPFVQLLEVTDEMRRIGGDTLRQCREQEVFHEQAAEAAFRLMYARQRVPLVSDAEIALTRERDAAIVNRNQLNDAYFRMVSERDEYAEQHRLAIAGLVYRASEVVALRAELMAAHEERDGWQREHRALGSRLDGVIGRLEAELRAAHDKLAVKPASKLASKLAAKSIINAIREHETDRRMVGR